MHMHMLHTFCDAAVLSPAYPHVHHLQLNTVAITLFVVEGLPEEYLSRPSNLICGYIEQRHVCVCV